MAELLFRHTTQIEPEKTAGDIMGLLCEIGASDVNISLEEGEATGMAFRIQLGDKKFPFQLPIRWREVYESLGRAKKKGRRLAWTEAQAKRTAWRMTYEWLRVQMAFISSGGADALEVFMPYLLTGEGVTLYQKALQAKFEGLLPAPKENGNG